MMRWMALMGLATDDRERVDAFTVSMGGEPYAKSSHAAVQRRIEVQNRQ